MRKLSAIIVALAFFLAMPIAAHLSSASSAPTIQSISPDIVLAGTTGLTVTVAGTGFTGSSLVQLNGESLPTVFVDSSTLKSLLPDSRLATSAALSVTVFNTDTSSKSAVFPFFVESPLAPSVTSISPSAGGLGTTVQITVSGMNLIGASLNFSGIGLTATSVSGTSTAAVFQVAVAMNTPVGVQHVTVTTLSGSAGTCGTSTCGFSVFDAGSWLQTGLMNKARAGGTFVRLLDGRILAAGGSISGRPDSTAEIFDPSTGIWSFTSSLNVPRYLAFGVLLPDGRVLVGGGSSGSAPLTSVEIFDPTTATWTAGGFMSGSGTSAVLLIDGRVLISDGEIYNPVTSGFSPAQGFAPTLGRFITLLPGGKVLITDSNPEGPTAIYIYDPAGTTSPGPVLNFFYQAGIWGRLLPDQRVLLRGAEQQTLFNFIAMNYGSTIINGQTPAIPGPSTNALAYGADSLLPSGLVFIAGGSMQWETPSGPSLYDPVADNLTPLPSVAANFSLSPVLPLNDGRVLLIADNSSSTYIYKPGTYSNPFPFISGVTSSTPSSSADFIDLTVQGNAFLPNSAVQINGTNLVTIYMGNQRLIAFVPPSLRSALQTYGVNVLNPGPGGGATNSVPSGFTAGPPILTAISPSFLAQGTQANNVIVSGQNLSGITSATFSGTGVTATIQNRSSSATVNLSVQVSLTAAVGLRSLTVATPAGSTTLNNALQIELAPPPSTAPLPIPVVESGPIQTGYVVIQPDQGTVAPVATLTYGMVQGGVVQSKGALLPTPPTLQTAIPVDVVPAIARNLGLAIANTSGTSATVTMMLRDPTGNSVAPPVSLSLAAGQQTARFITELLPAGTINGAFQGSLLISSSQPVSVIGLNFAGVEFSTIPIFTSGSSSTGSSPIVFPQFAQSGGWATTLSLVNTSTINATGTVSLFDASGNPLSISWNGSVASRFTYTIASNGSVFFAPRDSNGQSPF